MLELLLLYDNEDGTPMGHQSQDNLFIQDVSVFFNVGASLPHQYLLYDSGQFSTSLRW